MKRLLLLSVLGLSLLLPLSSYAGVNAFSVQVPVEKSEVNSNLGNGYVANDFGDTLNAQDYKNDAVAISDDKNEKFLVFGVDLNSINKS